VTSDFRNFTPPEQSARAVPLFASAIADVHRSTELHPEVDVKPMRNDKLSIKSKKALTPRFELAGSPVRT
jgi:hypothetical protein